MASSVASSAGAGKAGFGSSKREGDTRDVVETSWRDWLAFWILGTVNNLGFVVVLSGAKSLAEGFNDGNLIGVLNWADVAFGLAVKSLNAMVFQVRSGPKGGRPASAASLPVF